MRSSFTITRGPLFLPNNLKSSSGAYKDLSIREDLNIQSSSFRPNQASNKDVNDDDSITMRRSTPRELNVSTRGISAQRHPASAKGKYPHSEGHANEDEDIQEMETNRHSPFAHRLEPMQRAHKTTGGVRLAPTPTDATFPTFEDDTDTMNMQASGSPLLTPQSSFRRFRRRGSTIVSQTTAGDPDDMSPFPSFTVPVGQEERTEAAPPTRQQVLAFMKAEINAFNSKRKAKGKPFVAPMLLRKVRESKYDHLPGSADGEEYDGSNGVGEVQNLDGINDRVVSKENERIVVNGNRSNSHGATPTRSQPRRSTRQNTSANDATLAVTQTGGPCLKSGDILPSSPLKKAIVPPPTPPRAAAIAQRRDAGPIDLALLNHFHRQKALVSYVDLLQTHLDAFPAIYAKYPTLRTRPWDIIQLRERLPPIEWNSAFRLKLDIFVDTMDWVKLSERDVFGIESVECDKLGREMVQTVRGVLNDILERGTLLGPAEQQGTMDEEVVQVVVRNVRVERVVDALREKFAGMREELEERQKLGISAFALAAQGRQGLRRPESTDGCAVYDLDPSRIGAMTHQSDQTVAAEGAEECTISRYSQEKYAETCRLESLERVCLLIWLWFLGAVPGEVLQVTDIANVGRVFRTMDDKAVVPSGAVVLMGE